MKSIYKKTLSILLLLVILALFAYYIYNHLYDFKELQIVNPFYIIVLIILFIVNYYFTSSILDILLRPFKISLNFVEAFMVSISTGFYNLITPFRGGMIARGVYLKKQYKFPYVDFLSTLAASYVLIFLVASIFGLLSTYLLYQSTQNFSYIIPGIFLFVFISMLSIIVFSPKIPQSNNSYINKFIKVINGWHLIKNNKRVIFATLVISTLQLLISSFMLFLQFKVFDIHVSFISCLFLSSIGSIGILLAITPAGLGISEVITVFSALTIGITPAQSLTATILGRVISMIVLFTLGPIFSYILLKRSNKIKNKKK